MKKLLIIRFSSIGDIVLTTPVIRCLKKQKPEIEIHYLTKSVFSPVIEANPYIDKIHQLENSLRSVIEVLKAENYDFIVDLHRNLRSRVVISRLKKPSATFPKLNAYKWLLVNTKINLLPDVHIVHRYLKAVQKLKIRYDGQGLDYVIPAEEQFNLSETLSSEFQEGYMLIVVGGKHKTKQIPEHKFVDICNQANYPVVIAGGKEDSYQAEEINKQLKVPSYNSCGKFSINESAWLVHQSSVVLTPDTGLMHIAAAFHKPLVTMWGNTVPDFGMYPFLPNGKKDTYRILEIEDLNCRPCSKIGFERCPKGHFRCMNDIPVEDVLQAIREVTRN
ncbi:MAG: glycosyltransferase family 9 protein [Bacteroidales bacterium]